MVSLKPLKDQVLVLTGASSGIGLVTARMAAKRGARLVLAARNGDALRRLVEEIHAGGGQAIEVVADVGREEEVDRIARAAIEHFGGFDTWINNAGITIFGRCDEVALADMRRMFDTNFWGVVYGSLAAVRHFELRGDGDRGGALINVGSVFGDRATPVQATYSASKHAVHGWTEGLRMELEAAGAPVSVTLIHPGRIDTPYNEHARTYLPREPAHVGMIYPPEAVAEAILHAAEKPKRDIFIGSQAKLAALAGALAPRLVDRVMERTMLESQQSNRPSHGDDSALYHAGEGLKERGSHEGWFRKRSLYAKASTHPVLTAAAMAGIGLVLGQLARVRG